MNMLADPAMSDTVVDIVVDAYKKHHVDAETIMRAISTYVSINPFRPHVRIVPEGGGAGCETCSSDPIIGFC